MTQGSSSLDTSNSIQQRWAFLVGIDSYVDPKFNRLHFCVNDVIALEKLLVELGYVVVALYDQHSQEHRRPIKDNVEAELEQLCQQINKDDLLFVHFACHGKLIDGQPILIMRDTRAALLKQPDKRLSVEWVEQMMRNSGASRLFLSLDACHTGVEMGRGTDDPEFIRNVYELAEGFVVMAGSTAQQKAQEWGAAQHGVYTYYLLQALLGAADRDKKSFVSVDDIEKYVINELKKWSVHNSGLIQEPTIRKEGMGDMVLADWRDRQPPISSIPIPNAPPSPINVRNPSPSSETPPVTGQHNATPLKPAILTFEFQVVTLDMKRSREIPEPGQSLEPLMRHRVKQAEYWIENLQNGVHLELVAIPGCTFYMGSPENEGEDNEKPQHLVILNPFWMSKYPITQAQWQAVTALKKVSRDLDPNPSHFKGYNRPVECVSWLDAVEFCERLSYQTRRQYRLPSEAEWEFACRAGTTGTFHFGEKISSMLVNYSEAHGIAQEQTTDVGNFFPNAFGLYDMHGNVWEWCLDNWHDHYREAPTDGSAWLHEGDDTRCLRGGAWDSDAWDCRSATRARNGTGERDLNIGFRIVCMFG
jgi:formylglycine-generating enzyme required for sulfatase activity